MEERHPIPQNVTGFQFKLIGEMTVRQFAYLAGNMLTAYLMYVLPFPAFIKWPLVLSFVLLGVTLAFIPYQGRPMDRWIVNFFKAVFSPSQYTYQVLPASPKLRRGEPAVVQKPPPPVPPIKEPIPQPAMITHDAGAKIISVNVSGLPTPPKTETQPPKPFVQVPETPIITAQGTKSTPQAGVAPRGEGQKPKTKEEILASHDQLQQELTKIITQRTQIEDEMRRLREAAKRAQKYETTAFRVRSLPQETAPQAGIPTISQAPNLLSGIVKDSRGNVLPNILVEVKDEYNNLVRAFKTNKLGRFTAATALDNGKYFIELEDPQGQFKFDRIGLALTGTVVLPLEIVNLNSREDLRRKLFSQ